MPDIDIYSLDRALKSRNVEAWRNRLIEQLAAIEHERWAHWQDWMHRQCRRNDDGTLTIPAELVARWERQIATPYAQLSDREKDSDRQQVDRYWPIVAAELAEARRQRDEARQIAEQIRLRGDDLRGFPWEDHGAVDALPTPEPETAEETEQ